MNREKILDIATKLPREAYIDLLCAGARWIFEAPGGYTGPMMIFRNLSYNQLKAICKAYCDEDEDEDEGKEEDK